MRIKRHPLAFLLRSQGPRRAKNYQLLLDFTAIAPVNPSMRPRLLIDQCKSESLTTLGSLSSFAPLIEKYGGELSDAQALAAALFNFDAVLYREQREALKAFARLDSASQMSNSYKQ